jgi:hypothetical protein
MIQGGSQWQVGRDQGDDVYWDTSVKDQVHTVGAGLGWWPWMGKLYVNAKWWTNYGQRQHFKANTWQVNLIWVPWMKKADKVALKDFAEQMKGIKSFKDLKNFED